ncbi:MAG: RNA 2'-phosphotransferase [Nonomuraea sp.]|nr:RNA 2'-phosphotransferase [Nonomuraea sp.]NUP42003.1 RNA 2'-phosphotransferase [Streptomyces sp.]NUP76147.1 RNA 2'-phosphotransferase [Nonomuraea sp.]
MDERRMIRISKYLARHLRHDPRRIGLTLDAAGWVPVDDLLDAAAAHGFPITPEELRQVVAANDKRRYAIEDGRIRASQGHSVPVELGLTAVEPPAFLYHGTVARNVAAIRREGLRPMSRHHVHLSPDRETAVRVGARRGVPVVLVVGAADMHAAGHHFLLSANGVWLADHVPPGYLRFPS